MSFLSGLMNANAAVEAEAEKQAAKPPRKKRPYVSKVVGKTCTEKCMDDYAALFEAPHTVGNASAKRGISYVGCLNQVYRYEKKGLIKRVGTCVTNGRAILWQWVKDKK